MTDKIISVFWDVEVDGAEFNSFSEPELCPFSPGSAIYTARATGRDATPTCKIRFYEANLPPVETDGSLWTLMKLDSKSELVIGIHQPKKFQL
jgi:hypothetical protein